MSSFDKFELSKEVMQGITNLGFEEPSPIQEECIPMVLKSEDIIGQAQTGTGKTAAFGIPLLEKVNTQNSNVQSIIITPTRELAIQVSEELRKISQYKRVKTLTIYGGQPIVRQIKALKQNVHVVIATPGRLLDHLKRGTLRLSSIELIVLDEADEMLDMGFVDDIESIMKYLPEKKQVLLFSATMPPAIRRLSKKYMTNPKHISISKGEVAVPTIEQHFYRVLDSQKVEAVCRILDNEEATLGIIFCRTKKGVDELTESLQARGYLSGGLHGDLAQQQRDRVMNAFRKSEIELLVATDVAARGIDVGSVSHVINFDIPQDAESYVHRIGRTGRAGKLGIAITLVNPRELKQLRLIERETGNKLKSKDIPTLEQVAIKQQKAWATQLQDLIESDTDLSLFQDVVDSINDKVSQEKIASAALYLAFADKFSKPIEANNKFGETGASPGMVRFFVNVGRNIDMKPQDLARAIADNAGISPKNVGRINIYDRFSFIEVNQEVAPFVYEANRKSNIRGTRVNIEPAKPRSS